jgi:hypothetical protein
MTEICIPWKGYHSNTWWNEICARIVDKFGLPGGKYTTEVSQNEMKFFFKDEREALLCKIMISEDL